MLEVEVVVKVEVVVWGGRNTFVLKARVPTPIV